MSRVQADVPVTVEIAPEYGYDYSEGVHGGLDLLRSPGSNARGGPGPVPGGQGPQSDQRTRGAAP